MRIKRVQWELNSMGGERRLDPPHDRVTQMAEDVSLDKLNFELPTGPILRKSLGQHVFESLKEAIIRGDLRPGSRVVESRVADALGISRTPVREAIHKLERENLVEKRSRGGFCVIGLTLEDIEETFGIRSVLESYAARLAALHHREEELEELREKIAAFQACLERGELDDLTRINTEFHDLLYSLSRSPKLIRMINGLRDRIYRFRRIILKVDEMADTSNRDHREMLEAMKQRDADRVEVLVKEHILRGQKIVLEKLADEKGDF